MAAATSGGPDATRRQKAGSAVRAMRPTLLAVGALLVASIITVVIAYATRSSGASGDVQARLSEYKISMPARLAAGKHSIVVTNAGTIPHELVIFKTTLATDALPTNVGGDVNEDSPQLTSVADSGASIAPGGSRAVATSALAPGHYVAVCNLSGHYQLGMRLDITVR